MRDNVKMIAAVVLSGAIGALSTSYVMVRQELGVVETATAELASCSAENKEYAEAYATAATIAQRCIITLRKELKDNEQNQCTTL